MGHLADLYESLVDDCAVVIRHGPEAVMKAIQACILVVNRLSDI